MIKPKNDARKQLLLNLITGQNKRITSQNVSNTKQKISIMSDREIQMIQQTQRISSPSKPSNISTNGSKGRDPVDNSGVIVPTAVESPQTIDTPSCASQQSNETTSKNVPLRKIRHASKAALQAIGKIARFERMKEKSIVSNILDKISIDSEFEVSVYRPPPPSQHSTVGTKNSTIFSDDDTKKSPVEQVAIPQLPKMLTKISMDQFVDENTITEMSGIHTNENLDNLFVNINMNNMNNTMMHQDKNNNTSPLYDKDHDHDDHTQKSNKVVTK